MKRKRWTFGNEVTQFHRTNIRTEFVNVGCFFSDTAKAKREDIAPLLVSSDSANTV